MADLKLSQLPIAAQGSLTAADIFASVVGGVTSYVTRQQIHTLGAGESLIVGSGAATATSSHDGTIFTTDFANTTGWNITGMTGSVRMYEGMQLQMFSADNSKYMIMLQGPSNVSMLAVGATNWDVEGLTGAFRIRDGAGLKIYDALDTANADFYHDGTNFKNVYTNTGTVDYQGGTRMQLLAGMDLWIRDGAFFRISDATDTKYTTLSYVGNNFYYQAIATEDLIFSDFTGLDIQSGASLKIRDSGDTDWAEFSHNGTDFITAFTNTADWDITGLTQLRYEVGTVTYSTGATAQWLDSTNTDNTTMKQFIDRFAIDVEAGDRLTINTDVGVQHSGGGYIELRDGGTFRIQDALNTDWAEFSHNGTNFVTDFTNTTTWSITGIGNVSFIDMGGTFTAETKVFQIFAPQIGAATGLTELKIGNGVAQGSNSNDGKIVMYGEHNSQTYGFQMSVASGNVGFSGTASGCDLAAGTIQVSMNMQMTAGNIFTAIGGGGFAINDAGTLVIKDATNLDNATFSHDGTDFNTAFTNTTEWNITGLTNGVVIDSGATGAPHLKINGSLNPYIQFAKGQLVQGVTSTESLALSSGDLAGAEISFNANNATGRISSLVDGVVQFDVKTSSTRLFGNLVAATPPTTEAMNFSHKWYDSDGTDQLALIGYEGSNAFRAVNKMRGGPVDLRTTSTGGVLKTGVSATPTTVTLFYDGANRLKTGIGVVDLWSDGILDTNTAQHRFVHNNGSLKGLVGIAGTGDFEVYNSQGGYNVVIKARDSLAAIQTLATFDPDAGTTFSLPGAANLRTAKVVVSGNAGTAGGEPLFEVNQTGNNGNAMLMEVISNSAVKFSIDNEGDTSVFGSINLGNSLLIDYDAVANYATFNNSGGSAGFLFYTNSATDARGRVTMGVGADAQEAITINVTHDDLTIRRDVDGIATYSEAGDLLRLERDVTSTTTSTGGFMSWADDTDVNAFGMITKEGFLGIGDTPTTAERFIVSTSGVANALWVSNTNGRVGVNTVTLGYEFNVNDTMGFSTETGLINGVTTIRTNSTSTGAMSIGTDNLRIGGDVFSAKVAVVGKASGTVIGIKEGVSGQALIGMQSLAGAKGMNILWKGFSIDDNTNGIARFDMFHFVQPGSVDGDGAGINLRTENASGSPRDVAYIDAVYDDISADDVSLRFLIRPGSADADPTEVMRISQTGGAILLSQDADVGLTAHVGSAQGNGVILSSYNVYSTVANAGDAATLPAVFELGTQVYVKNDGANSMDVFPASGDDAGAGTNTAVAVANGDFAIFIATVANATWTKLAGGTA